MHLKFFFDLISMIPGLDFFRLLVFEFVLYRAGHGQKNVIFGSTHHVVLLFVLLCTFIPLVAMKK